MVLLFIFKWRNTDKRNTIKENAQSCSVIICAKNEASNIPQFLPKILQQKTEDGLLWEVLFVDDGSTDNTAQIIEDLQKEYAQLNYLYLHPDKNKKFSGKKNALFAGIKAAKYNTIVLTDADCAPKSDDWLSHLLQQPKDIVLGYGAYQYHDSFLNKCIRWETVHTFMQYASFTHIGLPYMGVGRNLVYRKEQVLPLFTDAGFVKNFALTPSGDDDLIVATISNAQNTQVLTKPNTHTISIPKFTWKAWWIQKKRHSSTGKYYSLKIKLLLGLYAISHSLFWWLGLALLIATICGDHHKHNLWLLALMLGISRITLYWINALIWYKQLGEKKLSLFYPLGDWGWALYNVILSPYIFWKNKQQWK